jgi:large repetitive protein
MAVPTWIRQTLNRMLMKRRRPVEANRRALKLQLEVLEDRVVPTTLYVGSASQFSSTTVGAATTWTPGPNFAGFTPQSAVFGTTAFTDLQAALIQAAADYNVSNTDAIEVAPGSYLAGDYNITSPVTLQGANSGATAAAVLSNYQTTPADTTVITAPSAANPAGAYNDIFRVLASNVSISGFVLEGSSQGDDGITNFDGTQTSVQVSNITIQQDIVQDFNGSGIYLDDAAPATQGAPNPSAASTGNAIQNNYVANNGNGSGSFNQPGIGVFDNFFANITNNTVVVPAIANPVVDGITVSAFNTAGISGTQSMSVSGNSITVGKGSAGVFINPVYRSAVTISVLDNSIQAATGVTETASGNTWGLAIKSVLGPDQVIETGDTIGAAGGQFAQGIDVWNTGTGNVFLSPVQVGSASLAPVIGIDLSNSDPSYGSSSTANSVSIQGGTIYGSSVGVMASGVANLTLSNVQLHGPTALSGAGLTGAATLSGVTVQGSGSSSLAFTGASPTLAVTTPLGQNTVAITGTSLTYDSGEAITYSGLPKLTVTGDDGPDAFTVTPAPNGATLITVNGNTPNSNPIVDTLALVQQGLANPVVNNTGPGAGNLTSASFAINNPAVVWTRVNLVAPAAPVITGPSSVPVIAIIGTAGTATMSATGTPAPSSFTYTSSPSLPAGMIFNISSSGNVITGVLSWPSYLANNTVGTYTITLHAASSAGNAVPVSFTFEIEKAGQTPPGSFSNTAGAPQAYVGTAGSYTLTATGTPAPLLMYTSSPPLPAGFIFNTTINGNTDTGVFSWPSYLTNNSIGTYVITVTASSSAGTSSQTFGFGIAKATGGAVFSSANNTTVHIGTAGSFNVVASGSPTFSVVGTLPAGLTFSGGVLSWPTNVTANIGTYTITFAASNSAGSVVQPFTITVTSPQLLAGPANTNPTARPLTQAQLAPIVSAAITLWTRAGISSVQAALLRSTKITIGNLSSLGELADTSPGKIVIDASADGDGWYVDPTPLSNDGFTLVAGTQEMIAKSGPASKEIDLLTVVLHEMGHILGLPDLSPALYPDQLMSETLGVGVRRLPTAHAFALSK